MIQLMNMAFQMNKHSQIQKDGQIWRKYFNFLTKQFLSAPETQTDPIRTGHVDELGGGGGGGDFPSTFLDNQVPFAVNVLGIITSLSFWRNDEIVVSQAQTIYLSQH